ncbi:MAG: ABC transporter permease [Acidobacteriota bacterium]|nr:ABC transporter permease [Acidobacteriota bacterium]
MTSEPRAPGSQDSQGSRTVRLATALYRRVAAILPRRFRDTYAGELDASFEQIAAEARCRSRLAVVDATARAIADLVGQTPRQHIATARAGRLGTIWTGTSQDFRHGARRLLRTPSFTLASILTLALGIAAATSVFSLVYGVVLNPLPYPESDRIVQVDHGASGLGMSHGMGIAYGFYRFYADHLHSVTAVAMYQPEELTLTGVGDPVRLVGTQVTPSLDAVLRVPPQFGRWFSNAEGRPGAAPVVVLSHRLWRERFHSNAAIVGTTVNLEGTPRTVIGVMPASFAFPSADTTFWTPNVVPAAGIGGWSEEAVARLARGATPAALAREITSLFPLLRRTTDDPGRMKSYLDEARITPHIVGLKDEIVGNIRSTLWILLGTVGFVLLIAVANVANLFLVRAEDARRDIAVRVALGASRARTIRAFLAESLLLALAAGALGVGLAASAVRVLRMRAPVNIPRLDEVHLDPIVVAAALGITLLAALLLGLIPALRRQDDLGEALKEGSHRTTAGRGLLRGRNVLVAVQVALAMVLLIGAGLLFRTFGALRSVDPGFSQRQALTFTVGLPLSRYPTREAQAALHERLLDRLRAWPGVTSASAVATCLPLSGSLCWGDVMQAEGHPTPAGQVPPVIGVRLATTDYFQTMGIAVRGRAFDPADGTRGTAPVILSQAAAQAYFKGDDALGGHVRFRSDEPWHTVIGVASNVRARVQNRDFERLIYMPVLPANGASPPAGTLTYVVATSVTPVSLTASVRRTLASLDPDLPLAEVEPLQGLIDHAAAPAAFALVLIGLAATIALLLGAVGVYAVVAYAVSRRTAEIGLRLALGAQASDVLRLVFTQGGAVVLAGVAVGLAGAVALTRLMRGLLFGVSPTDPLSYAVLTGLMLLVAALAVYLPARRASRVDPTEALRSE